MLTERSRRDSEIFFNGSMDGPRTCRTAIDGIAMIPVSSSSPHPSSLPSSPSGSSPGSCIHHRVSKMDTLAGVAIKYGVEVADIKRLNGLVTDLQMFAHKSLQIPLPGRHPPSHSLSNGSVDYSDYSPRSRPCNEVFDLIVSFNLDAPREVSPAMSRLQGFYGLTPSKSKRVHVLEGEDKAITKTGRRCRDEDDVDSPSYRRPPSRHRKTKSLVNGFTVDNCVDRASLEAADNGDTERSVRRRQKGEGGPSLRNPEPLLNEDEGMSPVKAGRGIAPRPKLGSRIEMDVVRTNGDMLKAEAHASVRKSSSTSCLLQDPDSNNNSMWPTSKWILKPEVLSKPIFDGFPKSIGVRRNKAALD